MSSPYMMPDQSVYVATQSKMNLQRFTIITVTAVLLVAFVTKTVSTYTDRDTVQRIAFPIAIGVASMFAAGYVSTSKSIQSGLILGGVLLILKSVLSHWGNIKDEVKVMILGGALASVIYGGSKILA